MGANDEIDALAGDSTRVIDLEGRTAIPGLIDNHNHLIFNAPTWPNGVRLGRVRTRAEALERIAAKAAELGPGDGPEHIVFAIGGWNPVQFTDDQREFTREELDAVAPDNPVYTQISWGTAVLNTKAMELGGITNDMPDPGPGTEDESGVTTTAMSPASSRAASFSSGSCGRCSPKSPAKRRWPGSRPRSPTT